MNYDLKMEEQINNMEGKVKTLLLHACCAPCSSACLERLGNNFKISIFYYNPNITSKSEYDKRLAEVQKFAAPASSLCWKYTLYHHSASTAYKEVPFVLRVEIQHQT